MQIALENSGITELLGRELARTRPQELHSVGAVIYLEGELGAGKTTCVRSLLRALGVERPVRSPTYTLVEMYVLPQLTCVHIDLYRVLAMTEMDELGLREVVGPGCLLLIEWPDRGGCAVPRADVLVQLRYQGEARAATLKASSPLGAGWLSNLASDNSFGPYVSNLA